MSLGQDAKALFPIDFRPFPRRIDARLGQLLKALSPMVSILDKSMFSRLLHRANAAFSMFVALPSLTSVRLLQPTNVSSLMLVTLRKIMLLRLMQNEKPDVPMLSTLSRLMLSSF